MKRLLFATILLAAPAWMPGAALQASPIQRCIAGGSVVYTDKACRSLGAQPTAMSAELIRGLAREAKLTGNDVMIGDSLAPMSGASPEAEAAKAYLAARHGTAGCARTPEQLQLLLRGAVSMGDVNRIATAYHWAGMGSDQARHVLTRLESLGESPVTSTQYYNATIVDASFAQMSPAALQDGGGAGYLQLVQGGGSRVTEFEVHKLAGCYFVSF